MEWHHSPLLQIIRAAPAPVPQRHLAVACWPSAQPAIIGLCAWVALATPTDMLTANRATVKVFNILASSLICEKAANTLTTEVGVSTALPFQIGNAANNLKTSVGDGALIYVKDRFDLDQSAECGSVVKRAAAKVFKT